MNQPTNRIREEIKKEYQTLFGDRFVEIKNYADKKDIIVYTERIYKLIFDIRDWWLSKIAELLKSQKESLVEELKIIEKMPGVHLALHDFIQNLIKEDK